MRFLGTSFLAFILTFCVSACASMRVGIDYDREVEFGAFCTFAWLGVETAATGNPLVDDNALLDKRIRGAVDRELQQKGLLHSDLELADLTVHYHVALDQRTHVVSARDHEVYGGTRAAPSEAADVVEYTQGTLILDIHDASTEQLIWRAIGRDVVDDLIADPSRLDAAIDRAVTRMLARFPPRGSVCAAHEGPP